MSRTKLFPAPILCLIASVLLLASGCGFRAKDSSLLDKAEDIRLAAKDPGNYGRPVRIRGVVTYCDPEWHLLFLQDETGGFFVGLSDDVAELKPGRLVEISGKLAPGNKGIEDPHFKLLGSAPLPPPQALPEITNLSKVRLSQWVQIHGTVRAAAIEDGRLTVTVVDGTHRTKARILRPKQVRPLTMVGAEIQLEGVSAAVVDDNGTTTGIQVFVASIDQVKVAGNRKLTDAFFSKPEPFSIALERREAGKLVHLAGTVVEQKPGRVLVLTDGTAKVQALLVGSSQFAPRDEVEVLGFTSASPDYEIEDSIVRIIAPRTPLKESQIKGALRTVRELKSLSVESALKQLPVDIQGTVTYIDPSSSLLFMQDATAGVYIDVHSGIPEVEVGDILHVQGVSGPGDYAPIITRPLITRVGHGPLPKPLALSLETLGSGKEDAGWVEMVGIVHSVAQLHSQQTFKLAIAGNSYAVQLPHGTNTSAIQESLLDAQVRIGGVCGTVYNEKRQMIGVKFFVPGTKYIQTLEPAPADSAKKVRPIITLMRFDPLNLSVHRTTVRGMVTLQDGEHTFYLQDASAGMYVVAEQKTQLYPGQVVEVSGFPVAGPNGPYLEDASVRATNDSWHAAPVKLTAEDLTTGLFRSQLVTVEGHLLERVSSPDEDILILKSGPMVLRASLQSGKISPKVVRGSVLEVTGILQPEDRANQSAFRIALPSPADVRVIQAASWWTAENTARTLAVVVIVILVALLWVSFSAYRVRSYQARHDILTGLPNRRSTLEYLERQLARSMRERSSLGVILADVDHFKRVNDTFGHQAGDAVLRKMADIFKAALRPYDAVGRYGGEEFLIVVPNCAAPLATEISERIRLLIIEENFSSSLHGQQNFHVTCSFGVAIADAAPWNMDSTLAAADGALYAAKNSGRNRVRLAEMVSVEIESESPAIV
ncbi:MAG TPA: GGDEF domain-containing protein [Candidatus Acidoferrum sp.]|nr:GGDEF domain-containing protein [Candidatus Acidoferrum sp.]